MDIHGNATAVVADCDSVARLVQRHGDRIGVAIEVFIDGVINDFPNEVMESLDIDAANIHGRPFANRL